MRSLHNRNVLLTVLEPGKSESGVPAPPAPGVDPTPSQRQDGALLATFSHGGEQREEAGSLVSLVREESTTFQRDYLPLSSWRLEFDG